MPRPSDELSPRLQSVLILICEGLSSAQISQRLHLSPHTIRDYRKTLYAQMGVSNVVELVNKVKQADSARRLAERPDLQTALAQPPKVLVVEDMPDIRLLVVSGLVQAGLPCHGVANRAEMLDALAAQAFNILVLDLNLGEGEVDGLVIAKELRERRDLGIVMMTSRGMVDQRIHGLALGADAYLVKPIDIRELTAVVRNVHRRLIEARFGA